MNHPVKKIFQGLQSRSGTSVRILRIILFAILLFFVGRAFVRQLHHLDLSRLTLKPQYLLAAAFWQVAGQLVTASAWWLLFRPTGRIPDFGYMLSTAFICRMGKYIPGKIASTMGAVVLLKKRGIAPATATGITIMHQGLMILVGIITAAPLTLWQPIRERLPMAWAWCMLMIALGMVCLHPRVFFGLGNKVLSKLGLPRMDVVERLRDYVIPALVLHIGNWTSGLLLFTCLNAVTAIPAKDIPLLVSANAPAAALGILALFAPAGLGVR